MTSRLRRTAATRRAVFSRGAALAASGVLAACVAGGASPGGEAKPAQRTQPVTLRFMSWRSTTIDRFLKKWSEWGDPRKITFEIERPADQNDRNTKLLAGFVAGQAPDVMDVHIDVESKFHEAGHTLVLDQFMIRDKVSQDGGYGLTIGEKWRGKTHAVAYWVEPFGIYYNKTLFKKRGVPDPWEKKDKPGTWTLEEMTDAARRTTTAAEDEWGLDWDTGYHNMGPFIWTQGVTHYDMDQMKWQLELPASVQAYQRAIDWKEKQRWNVNGAERTRMMQPWGGRGLNNNGMTPFAYGKVGIHYRSVNDWSLMFPIIKDQFEWDMLPMPSIGGRTGAEWTAGHPLDAWAKTPHPDEAWDFMRFMIGDDFQGFLAQEQVIVPAKLSAQAKFYRAPAPYPYQHPQLFADVFKKPHGVIWQHFRAADNSAVYNQEMPKIFRGEVDLTNGLKGLSARMNQDIEYGGGESPFKGLKLPIVPK